MTAAGGGGGGQLASRTRDAMGFNTALKQQKQMTCVWVIDDWWEIITTRGPLDQRYSMRNRADRPGACPTDRPTSQRFTPLPLIATEHRGYSRGGVGS
jgi:hypothetical protein